MTFATSEDQRTPPLPLSGLRVVEFSQMVMGPCCGYILAELGAEVIKVEPLPRGDRTRYLPGLAAGFFTAFNRGKKSVALDMKSTQGIEVALRLIALADVMIENFRPGMMSGLGLDYAVGLEVNRGIVYCSLKGFLPGPYDHRTALDEVVQMMAGLAYMTGPPGRPLRAGASVNDIMGGHVRRHRHSGSVARAGADRSWPRGADRLVRKQRISDGTGDACGSRHRTEVRPMVRHGTALGGL